MSLQPLAGLGCMKITSLSPEDVEIVSRLPEFVGELLGIVWRPEISYGEMSRETARAIDEKTVQLLGRGIEIYTCPHPAGPPICWCRKPLPSLGVVMIRAHDLDPAACVHFGKSSADQVWAERLGFKYSGRE